jgi:hypothetical protein
VVVTGTSVVVEGLRFVSVVLITGRDTYAAGAAASFAVCCSWLVTAEGATGVTTSLVLLDFSLLNTLLILLTYFPKLMRRSPFFPSPVPVPAGADIVTSQKI